MLALSIRQPYAELILRGIKTREFRSRRTRLIGERFYIYAARQPGELEGFALLRCEPGNLPTGVIVGTATIRHCDLGADGRFEWHVADVRRLTRPIKPTRHPQPAWSRPLRFLS